MAHWTDYLDRDGPDGAYLSWSKVEPRVGISRTTAWRLQKRGEFPKPYVMSPGRVAYRESEVEAWKASRGHRHMETLDRGAPPARPPHPASTPPEPPSRPQTAVGESFALKAPAAVPSARPSAQRTLSRARATRSGGDQMTFEF